MSYKSHSLNLWAVEDGLTKLDIDCHSDRIDVTCTNNQPVKIHPKLHLVDSVNGDIPDLAQKCHDIDTAIASGNAGSAVASALVQTNLDNYISVNDTSVGTLQSNLATETAQRQAGQTADATARATLKTDLESKISAEESRALSAESTLTTNLAQEVTDRATAVTAENLRATTAEAVLDASIGVERSRVDTIVSGASVNLDTLNELTTAYQAVDASVLNQIASMSVTINTLVARVNALTSGTDPNTVIGLDSAVTNLTFTNDKAFLSQVFSITFNMLDLWSSSLGSMLGWTAYRTAIVAGSSGALSGASTDAEVEAFLQAGLNSLHGANVLDDTLSAYRLKYVDPEHYCLEVNLPAGSKPYFQGVSQASLSDVSWRLSYCSIANDSNTIYSTILSGTQDGSQLTVLPTALGGSVEFPVSGVAGVQDGYVQTLLGLTI